MRQPKPYWKKSHKSWYVDVGGKTIRLGPEQEGAWRKWHELLASQVELTPTAKVVDLFEAFLRWSKANHSPGTFGWYRGHLESFCKTLRPSLRVNDLKALHLTQWIDEAHPRDTNSDNTRHGAMRAVQRAMNWAVEQQIIPRSPLVAVKKPQTTPRDVYLLPEQYKAFVERIDDEQFRDVVTILRETGCRPLEARKVEARHFDREKRCWVLPLSLSKGKKEQRVVLLNDRAYELSLKYALRHPDGPMFRNTRGRPWSKTSLNSRCFRLRAKLGFHVCPYSIRHTFATDAIVRGVDLVTIAQLMGHKNLQMLTRIYQHVSKRADHLREGLRLATDENAA